MSEVETPVVETTVEPVVETPEQSYEYQPTDEVGRPLGGKQVIKYRSIEELTQKLTEQNTLLIRKLREEKRKNRLGISETEQIPDEAPRFGGAVGFEPRQLSADERVQLSRDLLDPEKFDQASTTLFEATVGAKPEELRSTLTSQEERLQRLQAKIEADAFVNSTPEYYRCKENFETITSWMVKNDLAPVRENFSHAYEVLNAAGLLLEAPISVPVPAPVQAPAPTPTPVVEPVVQPEPTVEELAQGRRPAPVPTGLTRSNADDVGTPKPLGDEIVYEITLKDGKGNVTGKRTFKGLAAFEAMPSEEFKRRLRDPNFSKTYERLLAEKAKQRQQ